jgi:membrane protein implicated in regulation of membrane protease activity
MAPYTYWFALALVLAGLEMATGTFYMLVLAIAVALGGVAALAGATMIWQVSLAGVATIFGILILRRSRIVRGSDSSNDSFDIGQPVRVITWNADGSARVHYRGAEWDAQMESPEISGDAALYIKSIQGSKLILTQHQS